MKKIALGAALALATACSPPAVTTDAGDTAVADATMDVVAPTDVVTLPDVVAPDAAEAGPTGPQPDIVVDTDVLAQNVQFAVQYFAPNSCEEMEQCVTGPGWRRLLMFSTLTVNQGDADLNLGSSTGGNPNFMYNACHDHFHFQGYADYSLLRSDGTPAARGHKQSFCVEDLQRVVDDPATPTTAHYNNCGYSGGVQGISRGWADDYYPDLPCQWIDVTDVPAGDYRLHVVINGQHRFTESNYDNNTAEATITIPANFDYNASRPPTRACTSTDPEQGIGRECGWFVEGHHACTPGQTISVGCNAMHNLGRCTGAWDIRICDGTTPCLGADLHRVLQQDYGNASMGAWRLENTCPLATFVCPASGNYTVMHAPEYVGDTGSSCHLDTRIEGADGGVGDGGSDASSSTEGGTPDAAPADASGG